MKRNKILRSYLKSYKNNEKVTLKKEELNLTPLLSKYQCYILKITLQDSPKRTNLLISTQAIKCTLSKFYVIY